jgi:lipoprotein-anchoring transpeptidase ErfK/SrfK
MAIYTACFLAITLVTFWSNYVFADTRQDAVSELDRLHQSVSDRKRADELKSVDATFAIAEHYFQSSDFEQSERFYLLTIQKVRIILASSSNLPAGTTAPAVQPSGSTSVDTALSVTSGPAYETSRTPLPAIEFPTSTTVDPEPELPQVSRELITQPTESNEEYFSNELLSEKLVGTASTYEVAKGDTIRLIAAKLGVSRNHLIKTNKLDEKAYLKIGQKLMYNNRKIVPQRMKNGIVVNIPDRTLYYFRQGKLAISLPVALGVAAKSEKYDWKTPTGKFKITAKMKDPTWHVPSSIRSEMEEQGKEVITSVPPGTSNPLGKFAIKTSIPGILIHSTTKPWSIYSFASHGCIRVYPEQMEEFFKEVKVNTPGEIIYKPVKLAVTEEGRVFLEVHRDVYSKSTGLATEARRLIEKQKLTEKVDWKKVEAIVQHKSGIAEDISL